MSVAVRLLLSEHPDWVVITTDAANAFNSVSRRAVVDALRRHFPSLLPFVEIFYAVDGDLVIRMPWGIEFVRSRCGVQQGGPLGPLLFALALQETLMQVQATAFGDAQGARVGEFCLSEGRSGRRSLRLGGWERATPADGPSCFLCGRRGHGGGPGGERTGLTDFRFVTIKGPRTQN